MLVYQRLSLSFFVFDQQKKGLPRKKSSNAGPAGHNTTSHDLPMTSATNPLVMMAWKSTSNSTMMFSRKPPFVVDFPYVFQSFI
jgi:hypothetical protein